MPQDSMYQYMWYPFTIPSIQNLSWPPSKGHAIQMNQSFTRRKHLSMRACLVLDCFLSLLFVLEGNDETTEVPNSLEKGQVRIA